MGKLKITVCNVEEMRNMDRTAIDKYGINGDILMENAGNASFFAFYKEISKAGNRVAVVCGSGNNGGDGLVVARKFYSMNYDVKIFLTGSPEKFSGSSQMNYNIVKNIGLPIEEITDVEDFRKELREYNIIIDAIFGTGLTREVSGKYRDIIDVINSSNAFICSVDIPSGINGDTGFVMGIAVRANCTVTFGTPKLGNILYPGFEHCGKLYVTRISFPPEIYNDDNITAEISMPTRLPCRNESGHKGSFGDVLFIAGSRNYYGAPYFSAYSFLKAGGGYSRLAIPESAAPYVASKSSEIVFIPQKENPDGSLAYDNIDSLLDISKEVDFVVIGPGLSLNVETQRLVRDFVKKVNKPLLIDGDGITAISQDLTVVKERIFPTILTPHPGEMSRLAGVPIKEVIQNRINILRDMSVTLKSIITLKQAHTLIGFPDGKILINLTGNSALSTAGSGDVLTGTIAAMYGLGLDLNNSVINGVFLHGYAGELASINIGKDGVTAQNVIEYLPLAVKNFRQNYDDIVENYHEKIFLI